MTMTVDPCVDYILRHLAFQLGRTFPARILSRDDLTQIGWIGALQVPRGQLTLKQYQNLQILAGKRQMLDAFRLVQETRYPTGRKLEVSVADIVLLADYRLSSPGIEEQGWIENYDLATHVAKLSPLTQRILWGRFHDRRNREIGTDEHLSEGRISQLFKLGIQDLKKSGLVYASFARVL